jgi:hypothetical protein
VSCSALRADKQLFPVEDGIVGLPGTGDCKRPLISVKGVGPDVTELAGKFRVGDPLRSCPVNDLLPPNGNSSVYWGRNNSRRSSRRYIWLSVGIGHGEPGLPIESGTYRKDDGLPGAEMAWTKHWELSTSTKCCSFFSSGEPEWSVSGTGTTGRCVKLAAPIWYMSFSFLQVQGAKYSPSVEISTLGKCCVLHLLFLLQGTNGSFHLSMPLNAYSARYPVHRDILAKMDSSS